MKRICIGLGTVAVLAGTVVAQDYPRTPPPPGPLTPAPFPPFHESTLPNGLRLLVVESHKQPVVSLSLNFPAGSIHDPAGKEGLAETSAGLLTKGAGRRNAEQVAEAIESAGGFLTAGAGSDFLAINSTVLTSSVPLALELIRDAVLAPAFPESELELLRTQTLSALQVSLSQPEPVADRAFRRALYGNHPYGRSTTPAGVRSLTRADVQAYHRARMVPAGALLVVAGDVDPAAIRRQVSAAFQGWRGTAPVAAAQPNAPSRQAAELILVHRPGSVQSNILVGNLTYPPNDPRVYSAAVANQILGGGASSRLFMILREARSWTYGAYANYVRRKGTGHFVASTEVRTEVTDSALTELLRQLERIGNETVEASELEAAKATLTGRYPLSIESADQVANAVANARLYGLAPDYVQTYRVRLGQITAAEVQATARSTIRPGQAVIVVVGDGAKIYDRIKALAPVSLVDLEGKPLTAEDLAPKAAALELDMAALTARRDSFVVRLGGNPVGWQRTVTELLPDGVRYTESTNLGGFVDQTTVLEIDRSGAMRSVRQTGKIQGQDVSIDVRYEGGRAKGTARSLDPRTGQARDVAVDTALAAGTLDDNAIQALLPALRWAEGAKWAFNVMSAGQNEIKPWTLAVSGTEQVTVDGAQLDAYRAELTGGQAPLTLWVSRAAPHTLLKLAIVGQPVEFIRVNR